MSSVDRFQVDLAGLVDLLSQHLYSGPRVYLRELLQNAVDAITARQEIDPASPAEVRLVVDDSGDVPVLEVRDSGVGLTAEQAVELLATIGRSSKRDEVFGMARADYIGQFGIGLLAAFMVAESIEVTSRPCTADGVTSRWTGRSDGTFTLETQVPQRDEPGTTVRLVARRDQAHWLDRETVVHLAETYASLLPIDVAVKVPLENGEWRWRRITRIELPWAVEYPTSTARNRALGEYCADIFGFKPMAVIDLDLPAAGVSGVAFVLPQQVAPGSGRHRVYIKRMLVGERVDDILPEWAFFVRAVIDSDSLVPTASREQLHDDETLLTVREYLGKRIVEWMVHTMNLPTELRHSFFVTHQLALRAVALRSDEVLDLLADTVPFESTDGPITLKKAAGEDELLYTDSTETYSRIEAVARAQELVIVNGGYVYDSDLIERLGKDRGWRVRLLEPDDVRQVLGVLDVARELEIADAIVAGRKVLEIDDCDLLVREFEPADVPAVLLKDSAGEYRRDLDREREASPDRWGGLLDAFADETASRRSRSLVLNDRSEVVRDLLAGHSSPVFSAGLRSVYLSAVMLSGDGLRNRELAVLSESMSVLLKSALALGKSSQEEG